MDFQRRRFLAAGTGTLLTGLSATARADDGRQQFTAVRITPSPNRSRTAIDGRRPFAFRHFQLENPRCLVIDIRNAVSDHTLQSLSAKVGRNDPYIAGIRTGQLSADTVRIVIDLKQETAARLSATQHGRRHRLTIDLLPPQTTGSANPPAAGAQGGTRTAAHRNRRPVIVLDPGHGGADPGATGPGGVREKDVVLAIARETRRELQKYGYQVFLTRNEDIFVPLALRVAKARAHKADLFVSIHADSFQTATPRGGGVYIFRERGTPGSAEAEQLADTENAADQFGGLPSSGNSRIDRTIIDLIHTATLTDSLKFARRVLREMGKINRLHRNEVQRAGFRVLTAPDIPSILVESAFISNPEEERLLADNGFRRKVAQAIARGCKAHLSAR